MKHHSYHISKRKSKAKIGITKLITIFVTITVISLAGFWFISSTDPRSLIMSMIPKAQSADLERSSSRETEQVNSLGSASLSQDLSTDDESYVVINPASQQIMYSHNPNAQRAPASTQKLLTGLVAMKTLKETDIIRVGTEVLVEGSQLGLKPGDEISVHNLLTALYVHSSNDAAAALAVKTSGSISAFAQEMNEYAASLGCQNSHFTNPHGLPDPNQYTSAGDLAKIAGEFLKNSDLMNFVKEKNAHVQWKNEQGGVREADLQNTNLLLNIYPGDQGLKTGTTTAAGQCLVSYVTRTDGEFLIVLLGSKQRYRDTIKILDDVWAEERASAALKGLASDPYSLISSPGLF